jgi:hypothetical protein
MKIHELEIYVYDINNDCSLEDVKIELEQMHGEFTVDIGKCKTKQAGEWHDRHKLNSTRTNVPKYFDKLSK